MNEKEHNVIQNCVWAAEKFQSYAQTHKIQESYHECAGLMKRLYKLLDLVFV
jgi:hypothetical protein